MESGKKPETLEEGFWDSNLSQDELFCSEVLEDGSLVGCLSELNDKCVADACSSPNGSRNLELPRLFGNDGVDGVAGYDRMSEVSLYGYSNEQMLVPLHGNDVRYNDFPVFKEELTFSGNDGDQSAKVEEYVGKIGDTLHCDEPFRNGEFEAPMVTCDDVLHPHEPGSPTKIEVSGNSINLFVEVFGPLGGISDDGLDHPMQYTSGESDFKHDFLPNENGTLSNGNRYWRSMYEKEEDIIGEREHTYDNGDIVWIRTKTQSWWPGMVCYPSPAPRDMAKLRCLVKYYGTPSIVWCDNADLRPFVEYFEQISGQNNSRVFFNSVERAVCEIGFRVRFKMTCPCFAKDNQPLDSQWSLKTKEENFMSKQKASLFDDVSLSQFQPATFVAEIRDLARSVRVPGKIELMVMKSRLSPLYRSIGHFELPLQLLRSDVNDENHMNTFGDGGHSLEANGGNVTKTRTYRKKKNPDDKLTSSDKGMESRKRKKSRYLSYPYVDAIKGGEKEDLAQSSGLEGSCSGMDSRKRGTNKPSKEQHIVSKADDISACSAELLAELSSSGRDCSYISRSKYSDSLKRFYCSFRMFAFVDAYIASEVGGDQPVLVLEAGEQVEGSKVLKKLKKQKDSTASAKESVENAVDGNQKAKDIVVRKRGRKKEQVTNSVEQMTGIRVVKESENQEANLAPGSLENANTASAKESVENAGNQKVKDIVVRKRGRKKKEQVVEQMTGIRVGKEFENQEANLAPGSLENANKTENLLAKQKTNEEREKSTPAGLQSVQNPLPNIYPKSPWMISFHQACSNLFKSSKTPQKWVGSNPRLVDTNSIPILPDMNGIHPGFPVVHIPAGVPTSNVVTPMDHIPVGIPTSNLVTPLPEQKIKMEELVSPTINGLHHINSASDSSSKDVPLTFQNTSANNGVNDIHQGLKGDFTAQAPNPVTMSSFIQHSLQMGSFLSSGNPKPRKRKRKEETACQVAPSIPDLNGNVLDTAPLGTATSEGSHVPPDGQSQRKRRNKNESGESDGGSVLLNFAPGSVPLKETLVATFSRFGLLKESEIEFASDNSVKIIYERSSYARFAFRSLEKSHPFGESLLNFSLDSSMPDPPKMKIKTSPQLQTFVPVHVGACKNRTTKVGEAPDIALIKQNVEKMKSTLEKAGSNLSPEMRDKLEKEIKGFLEKISSVTGSSY
ncbi:hypothetical protein SASPL_136155 [Salvia splendens]|uniref:PWWP domain-containing protein n=1 Tax=Salvia splendens TaxID=180675 RepID=A0A8X8X1L5_SALSN|nr:uncharacterized protein LOC121763069 [Salvia splendens]KAG6403921.1 hypothetical protein SASPL_136155 [Salvia splendens]